MRISQLTLTPKRLGEIIVSMPLTLKKHPTFKGIPGPVLLCVMDGVGIGRQDQTDAVYMARTPTLDWLKMNSPTSRLIAHGKAVGMPSNSDMGNSEVGHNALGAGRIFDQGAKLVEGSLARSELFEGSNATVWKNLVSRIAKSGEPLHFIGLLSDGNVHSHIKHLFSMLHRCTFEGVKKVRLHALLDGRDVPAQSALQYLDETEEILGEISQSSDFDYRIASGGGRMNVTMDRYGADWDVVESGWATHVHGLSKPFRSARDAVLSFRKENPSLGDQFLPPFVVIDDKGKPVGPILNGASVICFNFRGDRAIGISRAFEEDDFDCFERGEIPNVAYAGMMEYDGDRKIPRNFLVSAPEIKETLGELLASEGHEQLAISETQKFGHVTYFWNGNRSGKFDEKLETYIEIPSDRVPFEQRPWMKSAEITDRLIDELQHGAFKHARVNYANGDMVGHTGNCEATILSVESIDLQLSRLIPVIDRLQGALIVTADHGNADEMLEIDEGTGRIKLDKRGDPTSRTSHSLNPVPLHVYTPGLKIGLPSNNPLGLDSIAGCILHLLGFDNPDEYRPSPLKLL